MKIKLRSQGEKEFEAEHLTSINCYPIHLLLIDSRGKFIVDVSQDLTTLTPEEQLAATEPITEKLSDPNVLAKIARSISAIFPSIPEKLVSYSLNGKFNMNLEADELFHIIVETQKALNEKLPKAENVDSYTPNADSLKAELLANSYLPLTGQEEEQEAEFKRLMELQGTLTKLAESNPEILNSLEQTKDSIRILHEDLSSKGWFDK